MLLLVGRSATPIRRVRARDIQFPVCNLVRPSPLSHRIKVAAGMSRVYVWKYVMRIVYVMVKPNGRYIGRTHQRLPQRIDTVVY
jgi:hypothetical protein